MSRLRVRFNKKIFKRQSGQLFNDAFIFNQRFHFAWTDMGARAFAVAEYVHCFGFLYNIVDQQAALILRPD